MKSPIEIPFLPVNNREELLVMKNGSADHLIKAERKTKKLAKKQAIIAERTLLSYERTLLSWVRTTAHLMTFGFAIYKLLEQNTSEIGAHPILRIISPKTVGMVMVFSGFSGLSMAVARFLEINKHYGKLRGRTFRNPAMIQSYVILALCLMIIIGVFVGH